MKTKFKKNVNSFETAFFYPILTNRKQKNIINEDAQNV